MRKKPTTFLRAQRPEPLTGTESDAAWTHIESRLGLAQTAHSTTPVLTLPFGLRPAFALVIIVLLVFTSGATVYAADNARPGDLLFPLDLIIERAQYKLTPESRRAGLERRFAEERVEELSSYLDSPEATSEDVTEANIRFVESYLEAHKGRLSEADQTQVRQRLYQVASSSSYVRERERQYQNQETHTEGQPETGPDHTAPTTGKVTSEPIQNRTQQNSQTNSITETTAQDQPEAIGEQKQTQGNTSETSKPAETKQNTEEDKSEQDAGDNTNSQSGSQSSNGSGGNSGGGSGGSGGSGKR